MSLGLLVTGGSTSLRLSLYDVLGRQINSRTILADIGRTDVELDVSRLASGQYFILVDDGRTTDATPISVVR